MSLLQIADIRPAVVSPDASVQDAMQTMLENGVGAVCVLDSERRVAGIFTERDVMRELATRGFDPRHTPVRSLMTTEVEMATEQTTESEALTIMLTRHYRHLPIVDKDVKLLGMLSIRHVLESLVEDLQGQINAAKK